MNFTKDDYFVLKHNLITKEFIKDVLRDIDLGISELINNAGDNSLMDKYRKGVLVGLQALIDWEPEFPEEEKTDNATDSEGPQNSY